MVMGLVELCKLIWTNLNLTLESQVTSLSNWSTKLLDTTQ